MIVISLYISTYAVVIFNTAFDAIFFESESVIVGNFKIMQWNLKKAIKNRDKKSMKDVIEIHNKIESCFMKYNEIFAPAIFNRFLTSGISICVLGFQLILHKSVLKMMSSIFYLILAWMKVLIYSYLGQIITDEVYKIIANHLENVMQILILFQSLKIKDAVFESDWLDLPISMKKDLIYIMMRSQKEMRINVGLFEVSLNQFNNVMSSTCSYIALLNSFIH
jgi:hypothetical protein